MEHNFRSSFLQFDITPNVSVQNPAFLQGMAGGLRQSNAVALPLSIEMCMLEDDHFTRLLIITADIIGFDAILVEKVRSFAKNWGIDPEGIILNASHTHYAPGTITNMAESMGPFYANYTSQILRIILSNFQNLYNLLEPCTIYSTGTKARVGVNRRLFADQQVLFSPNPDGPYIEDTPLLKICLNSSKRTVLWVNHGCHPTGMGKDNRISSDYSGVLKHLLKKNGIADGVMFFQGAGGSSKEALKVKDHWKFSANESEVFHNGYILADIVKEAIEKDLHPLKGSFYCVRKKVALPLKEDNSHLESENQRLNDAPKKTLSLEIQLIKLGDSVNMLTFPAEPTAELAVEVQSLDGFTRHDFLLGYTNGLHGYLPTDCMIQEGGYEVEQSHLVYKKPAGLASGTQTAILESVKHLINESQKVNKDNGYGRYHNTTKKKKAFFVLSSGRCGTMTLAHILNTATNAHVWHHPQPDPIEEALLAWWGKIDPASTFWKTRHSVIYKTWAKGLVHGETDLLMTPFTSMISKAIPESKFIILTRDPKEFIRSGMRRNYYGGHPWDLGRLRPQEESDQYIYWAQLNQFEKVCWLWAETYRRILEMTKILPEYRKKIVKFEDLLSSSEAVKELFQFLELETLNMRLITPIFNAKLNTQKAGHFPKYDQWPADMKDKFWETCGKVAEHFNYKSDDVTKEKSSVRRSGSFQNGQSKRVVFITGMHRSGTSFLSRALHLCGLHLPNPDTIGNQANEKGRWENTELSRAARKLFGPLDRWYDPVVADDTDDVIAEMRNVFLKFHALYADWGWKDPRTLIFFEYWKRLIPENTRFDMVVSIRNPYDVAKSLEKRNQFAIEKGIRLWERYNSYVLKYIEKGYPVHLFNFNASDKQSELNRICLQLNLKTDDSLWDNWFEDRLIHHNSRQIPNSPIYHRLLALWRKQAKADESNQTVEIIRPYLSLGILMVNGKHNYKDKLWLEKSIGNIVKYTSVTRDYRIFLWNHDYQNKAVLNYLAKMTPYVEVLDEMNFDVDSFTSPKYDFPENHFLNYRGFHVHRTPLQILYEYAIKNYAVDTFFSLDTDSWPIKPNWDVHIIGELNDGTKLIGVWRDEMASAIEPFIHASGLGIKAKTITDIGLRFDQKPEGPHEDTLSHFTRKIQDSYGQDAIYPLKRSNKKQYHLVYGGVYGDLIYHHHQGTVYRDGQQKGLLFKGSKDRGERAEDNKLICDALTEMVFFNDADYINGLLYGNDYEQFKIYFYLLKNRKSKERYNYMLQSAKSTFENKPLQSYFILNLIIRYYTFDYTVLNMMVKLCRKLQLTKEALRYEKLANNVISKQCNE